MSETKERSALEVLRRFNQLVDERHLVVMGPQDLTDPLWDDIEAVLRATPASDGGEVRERVEEILSEWEDLIGDSVESWGAALPPSPAEIADRILALRSGSGTPPGEGKVRVAAAAYLDALDEYRQECRTRDIPLAEYDYHEWRRLAEPVTVAERRLHEALRSAPSGVEGEPVAYTAEIAGEPVLLWPAGAAVETGNPTLTPLYAAPVPAREGEEARALLALLRTPSGEGEALGDVYEEVARYAERGSSQNGSRLVPIPTLKHWAQRLAALRSEASGEDDITGDELLRPLCRSLIGRIMEASDPDAVDTPGDVSLRLESIIRERDRLRSEAPGEDELRRENERLTKAWHAAHEARRRAEDEARLWFDRYQALRSEAPGEESEAERLRDLLASLYGTVCGRKAWERRWPKISARVREEVRAARRGEGGGE